jgi:hypothetical protein
VPNISLKNTLKRFMIKEEVILNTIKFKENQQINCNGCWFIKRGIDLSWVL